MTDLGFDTGFKVGIGTNDPGRPGLEKNILAPDAPRVIKSPRLSAELGPLLERGAIQVEHVIVPIRDLEVAAASRVRAASYGRSLNAHGGLQFGNKRAPQQRAALADVLAQLFVTIARFDLAHTLLYFPRFASDHEYTHRQLKCLDPTLTVDEYQRVMVARFRPEQIHHAPLDRSERLRMHLNTPVATAKRVAAVARRATKP